MKALWLMTNPLSMVRDKDKPFPINYAEGFIDRMLDYRESNQHTRGICMGGMVTFLAFERVPGFSLTMVDKIDTAFKLDELTLVNRLNWLDRAPNDRYIWKVGLGKQVWGKWLELPNRQVTRIVDQRRRDVFHLPRLIAPAPGEPQAEAGEDVAPPSPPHTTYGGASSSSGDVTLQSLASQFDQFRLTTETFQRRQMQESDYQMTYLRGLYAAGVNSGAIPDPYVNYPYHPPQQGPVPGWNHGQPTYPYHPPRPEGIDYRFPGGSDPQYDPDIPHFDTYPVYPPNYHSSVPPMEQTWGNAPIPPWGNYETWSGTNMDEDD